MKHLADLIRDLIADINGNAEIDPKTAKAAVTADMAGTELGEDGQPVKPLSVLPQGYLSVFLEETRKALEKASDCPKRSTP